MVSRDGEKQARTDLPGLLSTQQCSFPSYSEFHSYFTNLKKSFRSAAVDLGSFPRKLIMRSQVRKVANHRMGELHDFLQRMLAIDGVRTSEQTLQFFRQRISDMHWEQDMGADAPSFHNDEREDAAPVS